MTGVAALIWGSSLAVAAATSKVIYGLREEVRDARRLGQYTLVEKLGEGGMGAVYRARHAMLRRPTAIKLLPPERLGAESAGPLRARGAADRAADPPQHRSRIFDYGRTPDGVFYYAMEYLDGANLADVVAAGRAAAGRRASSTSSSRSAGALAEAHGIGLIHRDIKPANIILTEQGGVPDVGQGARLRPGQAGRRRRRGLDRPALSRPTASPARRSTWRPRRSPRRTQVDARTDLYALGAVGYFLLTGSDVFAGRNVVEVCGHHLHTTPVAAVGAARPRRSRPTSRRCILACLEKDPGRAPARRARAAAAPCAPAATPGAWSEEDARRWYDRHSEPLRVRQRRASVAGDVTIEVDLNQRTPDGPATRRA